MRTLISYSDFSTRPPSILPWRGWELQPSLLLPPPSTAGLERGLEQGLDRTLEDPAQL